jgi:hypothetical protein
MQGLVEPVGTGSGDHRDAKLDPPPCRVARLIHQHRRGSTAILSHNRSGLMPDRRTRRIGFQHIACFFISFAAQRAGMACLAIPERVILG